MGGNSQVWWVFRPTADGPVYLGKVIERDGDVQTPHEQAASAWDEPVELVDPQVAIDLMML